MKKYIIIFFAVIAFWGCATPYKQVKNSTIPFEGPSFSILPPKGEGWVYYSQELTGGYHLSFGKRYESSTHTLSAIITETRSYASFNKPDEFLKFIKNSKNLNTDPRRFKIIKNEMVLDNKFGEYCVLSYGVTEDHGAYNSAGNDFLIMEILGYTFIHPSNSNIIIDISYSERGQSSEINTQFRSEALEFIKRIKLTDNH